MARRGVAGPADRSVDRLGAGGDGDSLRGGCAGGGGAGVGVGKLAQKDVWGYLWRKGA